MHINNEETIYAPATSVGSGAISIIRISGPRCFEIADSIIHCKSGSLAEVKGYTIHFGTALGEDGSLLDEVLVSVFRAPNSYTGEDSVEISCHASTYIVNRILDRLALSGARLAEPGEFTRRAFLNGKMDLAQAEAVADVIASSSEAQHRVAMNQLRGGYSAELSALRAKLLELTALMELELDFSEEDVEFADRSRLRALLDEAIGRCSTLADSFRLGNAIRNGVPVAIIGSPNSGKSTLLNALLQDDRAIVSDIPGTTRDTIEETCVIGGVLFRFIDTAGIRDASDEVEKLGIERSFRKASEAQIILGVVDVTGGESGAGATSYLSTDVRPVVNVSGCADGMAPEDEADCSAVHLYKAVDSPISAASHPAADGKHPDSGCPRFAREGSLKRGEVSSDIADSAPVQEGCHWLTDSVRRQIEELREIARKSSNELIILLNKSDILFGNINVNNTNFNVTYADNKDINEKFLQISAKTGEGLDELRKLLSEACQDNSNSSILVTNARHAQALQCSTEALQAVRSGLDAGLSPDLLAEDLRTALSSLGSITGEITTDEVLGEIFGRFCIGK